MPEQVVTTSRILEALRAEYPREKGWAVAEEVQDPVSGRRADLMAVNTWDGRTEIVEVKMSRADALNDLNHPGKSEPLARQVSAWWLACPAGFVTVREAKDRGWGLMGVYGDGSKTRFPGRRRDGTPSHGLMVAFIRRLCADDTLQALLAEERAAGHAAGKKEALARKPAARYTKQDLENEKQKGWNERDRLARTQARKAEGGMS